MPLKTPDQKLSGANWKPKVCQWPLGEPGTPGFRFCNKPVLPGKPYCREHWEMAHVKAPRVKI